MNPAPPELHFDPTTILTITAVAVVVMAVWLRWGNRPPRNESVIDRSARISNNALRGQRSRVIYGPAVRLFVTWLIGGIFLSGVAAYVVQARLRLGGNAEGFITVEVLSFCVGAAIRGALAACFVESPTQGVVACVFFGALIYLGVAQMPWFWLAAVGLAAGALVTMRLPDWRLVTATKVTARAKPHVRHWAPPPPNAASRDTDPDAFLR